MAMDYNRMNFGTAHRYHDGAVSYQICADEVQDVLWVRFTPV